MSSDTTRIFRGPPLAETAPDIDIPRFVRERMRQWPDEVAIVDAADGRSFTYAEIDHLIGRAAAGWARLGLKPGDTVLMLSPNTARWPVMALGALAAGGVVSGANPLYGPTELAHQMRDAQARFVFTIPALWPKMVEVQALGLSVQGVVDGTSAEGCAGAVAYADFITCAEPEPAPQIDPDSIAVLPYSSGTTGLSKGVMLSHRTLISNVLQFDQGMGSPPEERPTTVSMAISPMFHIMGFTCSMLTGLATGRSFVTVPRFEPESFLRAIQDHRITHLVASPPLAQFLALHPLIGQFDLSSVRRIGCGAAPLSVALEAKLAQRLNCIVTQGYGMTESSGVIASTHYDRPRAGSCGQLLPGTELRVVDVATGQDCETDGTGELWFRGPQALVGYLNNTLATQQTKVEGGWVRTGDIGHLDADGFLFVTDRLKELIKVKGFQVPPAELEDLLFKHPAVADCCVIGRADDRSGERPVAYVVLKSAITADALLEWAASQVVEYKRLAEVVLCDAIPKSATGKLLRRVLREQDLARQSLSAAQSR